MPVIGNPLTVVIDVDVILPDGTHFGEHIIELGEPSAFVSHPTIAGQKVTPIQFVALIQLNKVLLAATGWNQISRLPGLPPGTTRWQALVLAANAPTAHPTLKGLGLTP